MSSITFVSFCGITIELWLTQPLIMDPLVKGMKKLCKYTSSNCGGWMLFCCLKIVVNIEDIGNI